MRNRPYQRLLAFALSATMAFSPVLTPMAAYATEEGGTPTETVETDPATTPGSNEEQGEEQTPTTDPEDNSSDTTPGEEQQGEENNTPSGEEEENKDENQDSATDQNTDTTTPTTPTQEAQPAETTEVAVEALTEEQKAAEAQKKAEEEAAKAVEATMDVESQDQGGAWVAQPGVAVGATAQLGTVGTPLQSFKLKLNLKNVSGGISYKAHVAKYGWLDWVSDGAATGEGNKFIQGIAIKLTGDVANQYDVQYRVCVQGRGWMDWTSNGEVAGTQGFNLAAEAVEVQLVKRENGLSTAALSSAAFEDTGLTAEAHVQKKGWLKATNGYNITLGTTGKSLRMEAIKLRVSSKDYTGNIYYQAHVQKTGWQGVKKNGQLAGTQGKARRIEALKVWMDGTLAEHYDVYYRLHVQSIGWMGWAHDGEESGTASFAKRVESIQIVLVPEGSGAPSDPTPSATSLTFIDQNSVGVTYNVYTDGRYQRYHSNGETAGTDSSNYPVKGITAKAVLQGDLNGGIMYRAHSSSIGWEGWVYDGATAGTTQNNVEAIKIKLTGTLAKLCDVYYRCNVKDYGWQDWAKNGASAGSLGGGLPILAYQIKLVRKDGAAPGSTGSPCVSKTDINMNKLAKKMKSKTKYLIMIDDGNYRLGVYKKSNGTWKRIMYTPCGTPSGNQFNGTFVVKGKSYQSGSGYSSWYLTDATGSGSIHSLLYTEGSKTQLWYGGQLNHKISNGCYRIPIDLAKWIYDKVPLGTTCRVYNC